MILHTQVPILPWMMEAVTHELGMVIKVSLLNDGTKSGPSGLSHQWGASGEGYCLVLIPLPNATTMEEVIPFSHALPS